MNSDEERTPLRHRKLLILLLIGLLGITTTVAANVTLNKGKKAEFGQGLYQVKACDQFVSIHLGSTSTAYNQDGTKGPTIGGTGLGGYSNVSNIQIVGLDPVACKGTTIRFKLLNSSSTALQIYSDSSGTLCSGPTSSCGYAQAVLVINSTPQADPADDITIVNQNGANVGYYDANQLIDYDATTAIYTLIFKYPTASMSAVSTITLESASNV